MGGFIRLILSAPIAALVTVILFLALYNQISPDPFLYTKPNEPGRVYFGNQILCECDGTIFIHVIDHFPEKPDLANPWTDSEKAVKEPPEFSAPPCESECPPIRSEFSFTKPPERMLGDTFGTQFPKACTDKGVEGDVTVRFDITPEGNVTNVAILETPDRCFNQSVISTIQRWKYKPQYGDDGKPISRKGMTETFRFRLTD